MLTYVHRLFGAFILTGEKAMEWCFLTGAKSVAWALFTIRHSDVTSASCLSDVLSCQLFCAFATDVMSTALEHF